MSGRRKLRRSHLPFMMLVDMCPEGCSDPSCASPKSSGSVNGSAPWKAFRDGPVEMPGRGPVGVAGRLHWRFEVDIFDVEAMSALAALGMDFEHVIDQLS